MRIEFEKNFFSGKFEKKFFLKIVKNFLVDFRRGGNYCVNSGILCVLFIDYCFSRQFFMNFSFTKQCFIGKILL